MQRQQHRATLRQRHWLQFAIEVTVLRRDVKTRMKDAATYISLQQDGRVLRLDLLAEELQSGIEQKIGFHRQQPAGLVDAIGAVHSSHNQPAKYHARIFSGRVDLLRLERDAKDVLDVRSLEHLDRRARHVG